MLFYDHNTLDARCEQCILSVECIRPEADGMQNKAEGLYD